MKKIVKWILPLVLIIALIGSAIWYMFVYDRNTVQDFWFPWPADAPRAAISRVPPGSTT